MSKTEYMDKSEYNHKQVERKWQKRWADEGLYSPNMRNSSDKFYNLWMFPYPSAEGLHAGHAFASTGSDVQGRFQRMNGRGVFQPIGYDSFGIHSENFAIKINQSPQQMLSRTTKHYEQQLRSLGHGYDWTRTVTTSDVDYYKWTQWLFVEMFKAGLAYKKMASVNWCPSCKTVLSDEQVMTPSQAGKEPKDAEGNVVPITEDIRVCERCGTVVEKKQLSQWFFRITDYADRLLENLDKIDWTQKVKIAQREWIGKKEGVIVHHKLKGLDLWIDTFSAYPAWLFADTFIVVAPEHPIVDRLVKGTKYQKDVEDFIEESKKILGKERLENKFEKRGVFTGRYAIDPLTKREMPIWLANFALMDFGTGIIRCSAHDVRDYEFATKYNIGLMEVVERDDPDTPVNAHGNLGVLKDSDEFTGRQINEKLIEEILDWIESKKYGERTTTYHLRDWLISRQRYWGPPIPMIYCESCAKAGRSYFNDHKSALHVDHTDWDASGWYPSEDLPVELPEIEDYKPKGDGKGPLANHPDFYEVKCPACGSKAVRETDVSDTFVDSSWYFLRYPSVDSESSKKMAYDPDITKKWLPVDLYFGGAEHSVLHLMYARFVTMVLHDLGSLAFEEPFPKFYAHGLMIKDGAKMSKSRGNVVNPDEYVEKFGADTLRLYLMFMGPMDGFPDFRDTGIEGMRRFLLRIWDLFNSKLAITESSQSTSKMHQTIKKVTDDIAEFKYNTSIASIMEYVNTLREHGASKNHLEALALLIAPFAPHLAEEAWVQILGRDFSVHKSSWPKYDEKYLVEDEVTIAIQINGKLKDTLTLDKQRSTDEQFVIEKAENLEKIKPWLDGKKVKNKVYIEGKIVNFVI